MEFSSIFRKAFDMAWHYGIVYKLVKFGVQRYLVPTSWRFKVHVENFRIRALNRLNIIKMCSHKSCHLNNRVFFWLLLFIAVYCSNSYLDRVQTTQSRAIRCIYRFKWNPFGRPYLKCGNWKRKNVKSAEKLKNYKMSCL